MVDDVEHNKGVDKRNDEEIDDSLEERRIYGFKKFNEMNNFEDFTHVDREDVKDLFDEGLTAEEIAIELDFSRSKVRQIISTLDKSKSFDDGDLEGLDESKKSGVAKSLKKKSNASGIPVGILRKVFSKGMQAWNAGHRPGVAQHQWAFGRVNSFITGSGGARKADADLWTKAKAAKERKKKKK
jgi:predicted transcriptional regulator